MKTLYEGILVFEEEKNYANKDGKDTDKEETKYKQHFLIGEQLENGLYDVVPEVLTATFNEKPEHFGENKTYKALIKCDDILFQGRDGGSARIYHKVLEVKQL